MKKKFLALFLTLCMVLTLFPATALAAEGDGEQAPADESMTELQPAETVEVKAEETSAEVPVAEFPNEAVASVQIGNETKTYSTLQEALDEACAAKTSNSTVTLLKNISLETWNSVRVDGYENGTGVVTLNGNNHTISGLKAPLFSGGFGGEAGIVIQNLTITGAEIKSNDAPGVGAFISSPEAVKTIKLTNCHLLNSTITSTGDAFVGGLVGYTAGYNKQNDGPVTMNVDIENCSVEGCTITAAGSVGAIIGHAGANPATYHTIKNCTVKNCKLTSTDNGDWRVGVVVGTAHVGEVAIESITEEGNTLKQNDKSAPDHSNLYGRFRPGSNTGKLTIDGEAVLSEGAVAVINGKGYTTLSAAVEAAQNGETITLLKTCNDLDSIEITNGKKLTLNLNGFDLNFKTVRAFVVNNGSLNLDGMGTITAKNNAPTTSSTLQLNGSSDDVADYSVVTIGKDVTVKSNGYGGAIFPAEGTNKAYGAKLIVNGRVESAYGLSIYGRVTETEGTNLPEIVVNPTGVITGSSAIYGAGYGNYIIKGTLEGNGEFGIEVRAGNLTVYDGAKITCSADFSNPVPNGNGSTVTGAAIAVSQHTTNLPIRVEIKGGTITETGKNGHAFYEIDTVKNEALENVAKDVTISITGGTFNGGVVSTNKTEFISGGTFNKAPDKKFISPNMTAVKNDKGEFIIVKETAVENITDITLNTYSVTLYNDTYYNNSRQLTATVLPTGSYQDVTWISSDPYVASVSKDGVVTAVAPGVAYVYAKSTVKDVTSSPCIVEVKSYNVPVQNVFISTNGRGTVSLYPTNPTAGQTVTLTVNPSYGYELKDLAVTDYYGNRIQVTALPNGRFTFVMPDTQVYVNAVFAEKQTIAYMPFVDVIPGSFYYDAVQWAVQNGITSGVTPTTFDPYKVCNRAEAVTFLWRAAGSPRPYSNNNPFTDVSPNAYYYEAVLWAVEKGITNGTSATTFAPEAICNRGQIVTFLWRANGSPVVYGGSYFSDVVAGAYYETAVQWAVNRGITNGVSNTSFAPGADCNRSQIVTFLYRNTAK